MSSGMWFRNDTGNIQVDETYRNLHLVDGGVVATTTPTPNPYTPPIAMNTSYVDIVRPNGVTPLIAVQGAMVLTLAKIAIDGATFTWRIGCDGPVGTQFRYFVYDVLSPGDVAPISYGLRLKDPADAITFDSDLPPLLPRDIFTVGEYLTNPSWSNPRTYASGRQYAVAFLNVGTLQYYTGSQRIYVFVGARVNGNQVTPGALVYPSPGAIFGDYPTTLMVIDVTGAIDP